MPTAPVVFHLLIRPQDKENMKIFIYDNYKETPESYNSPVSVAGIKPILKLDTQRYNIATIFYYIDKFYQGHTTKSGDFLVRLKDNDYINEFIGTWPEIVDFVKQCLSDAGIIKEKLGRKKIAAF